MAPNRLTPICLLACLWCFGVFGRSISGEVVKYNWEVKYMKGAPDCMEKDFIIGINGQFPGPTIKARAGDNVVVNLTNKLDKEGVVIHWHGIRQVRTLHIYYILFFLVFAWLVSNRFLKKKKLKTPWADGTAAISQCPIKSGDTFTYNFTVDKVCVYSVVYDVLLCILEKVLS